MELIWAQGRGDGRLDSYPSMRGKGGARAKDRVERRWTGLAGCGMGGREVLCLGYEGGLGLQCWGSLRLSWPG